ncbi:MAG TPA: hypothetical protein VMI73_12660 [Trebonia sp.]|nr:hypothetical protein [Trebonia sp.]
MTSGQPEPAPGCPVHDYTPYELKPLGGWTAFYDQLRQEAPVVRNEFGRGYFIPTRHEDILAVLQDPETFSSEALVAGRARLVRPDDRLRAEVPDRGRPGGGRAARG